MLAKRGRRSRAAKELSDDMETTLIYGGALAASFRGWKPAPPIEAQREGWSKHRATLMKPEVHGLPAGCRAAGYWRFDLHVDPPPERWCTEISELLQRGLIDGVEAARIEHENPMLGPASGPPGVAEALPSGELSPQQLWVLHRRLEEAKCAQVFHEWRGREKSAAHFAEKVAGLEAVLASAKEVG